MLSRSHKLFHAIEAVLDIACHHPAAVRSADIAKRAGVDGRYLEPALQALAAHNILASKRGRAVGGYRLTRPPAKVTLGEVVRAIRSLDAPVADPAKSPLALLVVGPVLREIEDTENLALDRISFEMLCRIARTAAAPAGDAEEAA